MALAPVVKPSSPIWSWMRSMNSWFPATPPQKVSALIPIMMWLGKLVSRSRTANGIVVRIRSRNARNASSLSSAGDST